MAVSLTEEARKRANLRLLQRSVDENIVDIVGNATHVVLYEFQNIGGWSKSDVEGSLFLVQIVQTQTKSKFYEKFLLGHNEYVSITTQGTLLNVSTGIHENHERYMVPQFERTRRRGFVVESNYS